MRNDEVHLVHVRRLEKGIKLSPDYANLTYRYIIPVERVIELDRRCAQNRPSHVVYRLSKIAYIRFYYRGVGVVKL